METPPPAIEATTEPVSERTLSDRWSAQDRALLKATAGMWPLPIVGALVTLLTVKFAITPDGGGYVVLAEVLRSGNFPSGWDFVREPGLPLLLRITLLSPVGVPGYLALSGFMAGTAVAAMGGVFYDLGEYWQRLAAGLVAVTGSIYISYSGYVMQQIGLALLFSH